MTALGQSDTDEGRVLAVFSGRQTGRPQEDRGAVAVEFALLLPLLMMFLFGIIQYGYGLFQLQAFNSALTETAESAGRQVDSCDLVTSTLQDLASGNGLDPGSISGVQVRWLDDLGTATASPVRLGRVQVSATFEPFKIGIPFVPFPDSITRTRTVTVQDVTVPTMGICG
jgi:hypothetical protein